MNRFLHSNLIYILFVSFTLLPCNIFSQSIEKKLDYYLDSYYYNKKVPSISAGVAHKGEIIWFKTKGFSDIENNVPAGSKTLYRIASISKTITAAAVMQLVEKGKINLDDDARKYIPYFPQKQKRFTIRQLLSHTAGIRNYREGEFNSKTYYPTTKDAVKTILNDSLIYEPGTKYSYTTLGYNLLAAAIENVSKMTYTDYIKKNILEPCQMSNTFPDFQSEIFPFRAHGYERNSYRNLRNAPLADLSIKFAGGGFLSTSEDLLNFSINLLNGKIIKTSTLDSMIQPIKLNNGQTRNYGLGFALDIDQSGRRYIHHSGGGTGFTSHLIIYPVEKLAAVYLTNIRDRDLDNAAFALTSIVLKKEYEYPKKSLPDRLLEITLGYQLDSALQKSKELTKDSSDIYLVSKDEFYTFGEDLIYCRRISDAIYYFKHLISEYPDYSKGYLGLADAYYKDGNKGLAFKNYKITLRLDPLNIYAAEMVKKLSGS